MSRKNRRKPRYVREEEARLRGGLPIDGFAIPVDVQALSAASRRLFGIPAVYCARSYRCVGCGSEAVYTARQQQIDYEVKKFHICTFRIRCEKCHEEWGDLRAEIRRYPERLRTGVSPAEAALMYAEMERYRRLNGGRFDRALYDRIARFRAVRGGSDERPLP